MTRKRLSKGLQLTKASKPRELRHRALQHKNKAFNSENMSSERFRTRYSQSFFNSGADWKKLLEYLIVFLNCKHFSMEKMVVNQNTQLRIQQ